MHTHIINAAIQIVPIATDKHPYEWVDEAIECIKQTGIKYEVGPFSTVLEGKYEQVMKVLNDVNEYLFSKGCAEWITNVQIQIRADKSITANEKIEKHKK